MTSSSCGGCAVGDNSAIEWTDATWNPTVGCTSVSPGCDNCYARHQVDTRFHPADVANAQRLAAEVAEVDDDGDSLAILAENYLAASAFPTPFDVVSLRPGTDLLTRPLRWTAPRRIFVNSLSDLFHADVPDQFIARVWAVMSLTPQHTYQVLTKRHGRMRSLTSSFLFRIMVNAERMRMGHPVLPDSPPDGPSWPLRNLWLGVSVEDQQRADLRIPALLETPAAVRWLSCEPLLGSIDLTAAGNGVTGHWLPDAPDADHSEPTCQAHGIADCWQGCHFIDWVVVGGESGKGARPMHPGWARQLRDQCADAGVPFLFKQWGEWAPAEPGVHVGDVCLSVDGDRYDVDADYICAHNESEGAWLRRVGKRAAGRKLDGVVHDNYPTAAVVS